MHCFFFLMYPGRPWLALVNYFFEVNDRFPSDSVYHLGKSLICFWSARITQKYLAHAQMVSVNGKFIIYPEHRKSFAFVEASISSREIYIDENKLCVSVSIPAAFYR